LDFAVGSDASLEGTPTNLLNLGSFVSAESKFPISTTPTLAPGQSITVSYSYQMSKPVAGFNTVVEVRGENAATGQKVG
jgi:hypothetical protein